MFKIALKSFKVNIFRYMLFFLGIIIAISEIFIFTAFTQALLSNNNDVNLNYSLLMDLYFNGLIFIVVTISIIYYSLRTYIENRIYDYKIFLILGARANKVVRLLSLEYVLGFLISLFISLFISNGLFAIIKNLSNLYFDNIIGNFSPNATTYKIVIGMVMVILLMVAYISYIRLSKYVIENIMLLEDKNEEILNKYRRGIDFIYGLGALGGATLIFRFFMNYSFHYPIICAMWTFGMIFMLYSGGSHLLAKLQSNKKVFAPRMIHFSRIIEKFSSITKVLAMAIFINYFALGFISPKIADLIPINPSPYPYDAIIIQNSENTAFYEKLCDKYNCDMSSYPIIFTCSSSESEVVTMSWSSFLKLYEERYPKESLPAHIVEPKYEEMSIFLNAQEAGNSFQKITYIDLDTLPLTKFAGRYREELEEKYNETMYTVETLYLIKNHAVVNVIGQYDILDGNIIHVLNDKRFDEYYAKISTVKDEPTQLILLKIPTAVQQKASAEILAFEEDNHIKHSFQRELKSYYISSTSYINLKKKRVLSAVNQLVIMLSMMICSIIVIIMSILSNENKDIKRYQFFSTQGIKNNKLKRIIKTDLRLVPIITIVLSIISAAINRHWHGGFYNRNAMYYNDISGHNFWIIVLWYSLVYIILSEIMVILMYRRFSKKIK